MRESSQQDSALASDADVDVDEAGSSTGANAANMAHALDQAGKEAGPRAGDQGFVTSDVTAPDKKKIAKGTIVDVLSVKGGDLHVRAYTHDGPVEVEISASQFRVEPRVQNPDDAQSKRKGDAPLTWRQASRGFGPRDLKFKKVSGPIWGKSGPVAEDVHQGRLWDCYFAGALSAVVQQDPQLIRDNLVSHDKDADQYTVRLYQHGEPISVVVDGYFPTVNTDDANWKGHNGEPGYMGFDAKKAPLWPMIWEKAFAQISGGWDEMGDGAAPGKAFRAITGKKPHTLLPDLRGEKKILKTFQEAEAANAPIVAVSRTGITNEGTELHELGKKYHLRGTHTCRFVRVDGTNLIFEDPHGDRDIAPIPIDMFKTLFFLVQWVDGSKHPVD